MSTVATSEPFCRNRHRDGYICLRERAHPGDHNAHDLDGEIVKKWRGGRSYWPDEKVAG